MPLCIAAALDAYEADRRDIVVAGANCGNDLLGYIQPQFAEDQRELNAILARLAEIDPAFPPQGSANG